MIRCLNMRRLFAVAFLAALALPALLMAGEKGKTDGCLTSLYNYPAEAPPDGRAAYRGKPAGSLKARAAMDSRQTRKIAKIPALLPKN